CCAAPLDVKPSMPPEGGVCAGGVAAPAAQVSDRHARAMPSLRTGTDFMQNPSGWSPLRMPRLRAADTGGTATFTPLHKVLHGTMVTPACDSESGPRSSLSRRLSEKAARAHRDDQPEQQHRCQVLYEWRRREMIDAVPCGEKHHRVVHHH